MNRYELRAVGVFDRQTEEIVLPGTPEWGEYMAAMARGEPVDPMPPPPPPPPPSPEEVGARAEIVACETVRSELRLDAAVRALRNRTPAQVDAWIDANVNSLADARAVLKILARIVALIARERI